MMERLKTTKITVINISNWHSKKIRKKQTSKHAFKYYDLPVYRIH